MRRREQADAQARRPIDALQHRAGGAFAISARHVDEAEPVLGIARQRGQLERVVQAQLRAKPAEAIQESDGFGVGHSLKNPGFNLCKLRSRPSVCNAPLVTPWLPGAVSTRSAFRARIQRGTFLAFATAIAPPIQGTRRDIVHKADMRHQS